MTQREEFEAFAKALPLEDGFDYPIDTTRADQFAPDDKLTYCERNTRKLWAAWQAAQAAQPAQTPGWQLVPVEPTQAMCTAGFSSVLEHGKREIQKHYKAMLAAAPSAEHTSQKEGAND